MTHPMTDHALRLTCNGKVRQYSCPYSDVIINIHIYIYIYVLITPANTITNTSTDIDHC